MADFSSRSAFAGVSATASAPGVVVSDRDGVGLATVQLRKLRRAALEARLREHWRLQIPVGPHRTTNGKVSLIGIGPETWFALSEAGGNSFSKVLCDSIGDCAAVIDQSDGYAVLRLSGARIREALAKGVPLDLHERTFKVGMAGSTMVSHVGVTIWRLDDENGMAVFEVATFRSVAASFWHWLSISAAEFGLSMVSDETVYPGGRNDRQ